METFKLVISIASGIVTLSGVIGLCLKPVRVWIKSLFKTEDTDIATIKTDLKECLDKMNALIVSSNSHGTDIRLLQEAALSNTRYNMLVMFQKVSEKGFITPDELSIWTYMFDVYRSLGGNSFVMALHDKINALPVKDE